MHDAYMRPARSISLTDRIMTQRFVLTDMVGLGLGLEQKGNLIFIEVSLNNWYWMKLIVEPDHRPRAERKQPLFMNRFRRPYSTKGGFSQKREQTVIIMSAIREKRLSYIPTWFHFIGDRTLLPRKEKKCCKSPLSVWKEQRREQSVGNCAADIKLIHLLIHILQPSIISHVANSSLRVPMEAPNQRSGEFSPAQGESLAGKSI